MHCHHEKLVIVDDEVAFVGGIDLTDSPATGSTRPSTRRAARSAGTTSPRASRGPAVATSPTTSACAGRRSPASRRAGAAAAAATAADEAAGRAHRARADLRRAAARRVRDPRGVPARAPRGAQRLIYLENQFLWSPEIVAILAREAARPAGRPLPALSCCRRSRTTAPTTPAASSACSPRPTTAPAASSPARSTRPGGAAGRPVYVHAKVGIVDDRWLTLGSANLNEHSLFNDTEMNVVMPDRRARDARRGCGSGREHLERPLDELDGDPRRRRRALAPARRASSCAARGRRAAHAPARPAAARLPALEAAARPAQGLLVDG